MPAGARCCKQTGQGGFTLVELLVVITIIIVLTGMLVPAAMDAIQAGQETVCASNLRQLNFAFTSYVGENLGEVFGFDPTYDGVWMGALADADPDFQSSMYCPKAKKPIHNEARGDVKRAWSGRHRLGSSASALHKGNRFHEGSYGFNGWLYDLDETTLSFSHQFGFDTDRYFPDLMNLDSYVTTPTFADGVWFNGWTEREHDDGYGTSVFDISRHRGAVNVVFLDGHAARIALSDLFYLVWYQNFPVGPREPPAPR